MAKMEVAEGVSLTKNENGDLASITIDLLKYKEALPALTAMGFLRTSTFEADFEKALSIDEAEQITLERIRKYVRHKD